MKVLVFGSLNIDFIYKLEHIVMPNETIKSTTCEVLAGGKGLNQAMAFAKTGLPVYIASNLGKNGQVLADTLSSGNVDISLLNHVDEDSGEAIIQVDENGNNAIIVCGNCNEHITEEYIESVFSHFEKGDILVIQNEINNLDLIINTAKDKGIILVFNPSPFNHVIKTLPMNKIDYLFINEVEGKQLTSYDDEKCIVEHILKDYPEMKIVLTLGERGAVYADKCEYIYEPAKKVEVVDTVGAGDTFTGYFIYGVESGKTVKESLQMAATASSIVIGRHGAGNSIPTLNEVEKAL